MKKQRDSGIELLRILAILMVICVHTFVYGNYYNEACEVDGIVASSALFTTLGIRACVNIFVIITGYFMINSKFDLKKSYKRLAKLYGEIWFYSVLLTVLAICSGIVAKEQLVTALFKGVFPITGQLWYFITNYFLLCLFAPFLNLCLQRLTQKQFNILICLVTGVLSFWLFFANVYPFKLWVSSYGYEGISAGKNIFSFIYIYILGAYIGRFSCHSEKPKFRYLFGAVGFIAVNYIIFNFCEKESVYRSIAIKYMNPFVVGVAVCLLMFFKDWHFHNKFINILGSTTLGVYAIHEFKYIRSNVVWDIFNFQKYNNENLFINLIRILAVIICIFLVCAAIELLRQKLFYLVGLLFSKFRNNKEIKSL